MHRNQLLALLEEYRCRCPGEADAADRIRTLVEAHADCFERTCFPGHVTGSAWVMAASGSSHLLVLHKKLGRWLQPGGHADGNPDLAAVALREATEESGLDGLSFVSSPPPIFDLDVHLIPATSKEPAHEHHDVRFLLIAPGGAVPKTSAESIDVRFFGEEEIRRLTDEESVLRMLRKLPRGRRRGLSEGG